MVFAFLTYHAFGALNYLHLDKVITEKLSSLNVTGDDPSSNSQGVWNVILNSTLAQFYTGTGLVATCHLTLTLIGLFLLACFRNHKTSLVKSLYRLIKAELYDPEGKGNAEESVPLEQGENSGMTPGVHRIRGIIDSISPLLETHGRPKGILGCCKKKYKTLPPDSTLTLMRKKLGGDSRPPSPSAPFNSYTNLYPLEEISSQY